jgi:hypothetical protein
LNDSHSAIILPQADTLPIRFTNHFDEQHSETSYPFPWLYVWQAYTGLGDILGSRIMTINGIDIDEILNAKNAQAQYYS